MNGTFDNPGYCPLKPTVHCAATAKLIIDSRCYGCPHAQEEILNNPRDAFGSRFGYQIENIVKHFKAVT